MAISPFKTWSPGEVLTASDLNSSFSHIINNAVDMVFPVGANVDIDGYQVIMDSDGDTALVASTDDRLDVVLGGSTLWRFNTVVSAVNGLDFTASATTNAVQLAAFGSDTNIDLKLSPKGTTGNAILVSGTMQDLDGDTMIQVEEGADDDTIRMDIAGVEVFNLVADALVINDAGGDFDVRIEGDTDTALFRTDAGNDRVAIGINTPDTKLHVHAASAGTVSPLAGTNLTVEDDGDNYITLLAPAANKVGLVGGDPGDNDIFSIVYDHSANTTTITSNATARITIASDGGVTIGSPTGGSQGAGTINAVGLYDDGVVINTGGWVLLDTATPSAASTADLETGIGSTYDRYRIEIVSLIPSVDGADLYLRVKDTTYQSDAADYKYSLFATNGDGTENSTGAAQISLVNALASPGNDATEGIDGTIHFTAPASTSRHKLFYWNLAAIDDSGTPAMVTHIGSGAYVGSTNAITGVRLLPSSGTITGTIYLYGLVKT